MILTKHLTGLRAAIAAALLSFSLNLPAQSPLITVTQQFDGLNGVSSSTFDPSTKEGGQAWLNKDNTFTVNLNTPVTLTSEQGLVVYMGRYDKGGDPTVIRVDGVRMDGETEFVGYAYLMYRGSIIAHEFSDRIFGNGNTYKAFKFHVEETANGLINNTDVRFFKFNLFVIGKDQNYPYGRLDPIRMTSDYYKGLYNYSYEPNTGILSPRNHFGVNADYPEETPWGDNNTFYYNGEEHELPAFNQQGGGQMPHITETTLYAMPGDVIPLMPFYDLPSTELYRETFSHWYGYIPKNEQTGALSPQTYKHVKDSAGNRLLDFLVDPAGIVLTKDAGYFAGTDVPRSVSAYVARTAEDLETFAEKVLEGNGYEYIDVILADDIDCTGHNFMIGGYSPTLGRHVQYHGTFDGNGHTLSNYRREGEGGNYYEGIFGFIGSGCVIRNLIVKDAYVSTGGRAGCLVGGVGGDPAGKAVIENVLVTGEVQLIATKDNGPAISYGGGVVGIVTNNCSLTMNNVGFIGTVGGGYGDNYSNGALIGRIEYGGANNTITNCYADAKVGYVKDDCAMFYATTPVTTQNLYSNIRSTDTLPVVGVDYNIYQAGMANVFNAFHIEPVRPDGMHYVRVEGIPVDDPNWPAVYIHTWGGTETKWPGIKLEKGNGFYYTYLPDCGQCSLMINNGNDGKGSNPENTKEVGFSAEGGDALQIDLSANAGDYVLTFNGHLKNIDKKDGLKSDAKEIRVKGHRNYFMILVDTDGNTYTKDGANKIDGDFSVFEIPTNFQNKDVKYSILSYTDKDPEGNYPKFDEPRFFATLAPTDNPTVYFGDLDFYTLVKEKLGFKEHDNLPCPTLKTAEIDDETSFSPEAPSLRHGLRWYGTVATFYQPLKTAFGPKDDNNIHLEEDTYHIAADFGHEFNPSEDYNLERYTRTIHEPVLNYRYVFHIKDGAKFADENTLTEDQNIAYLADNSRTVYARAGYDFQIRMNTIVPVNNGKNSNTTNFYYRHGNGNYDRVPNVTLQIERLVDGKYVADPNTNRFFFDATAITQGIRKYPDADNGLANNNGDLEYAIGDGNNSIYRVLYCPYTAAEEGTYRVRLVASDGSKTIKTEDGKSDLYLEEFIITFLPKQEASVLTEEQLNSEEYRDHRASTLEDEDYAGAPAVVVDFDQYRAFESAPYNMEDYFTSFSKEATHRSYKWPMLWQKSTYSFGYGGYKNYDYNEYIIANHSSEVAFSKSAENHKNPDGTLGLYDRLWYDTYNQETREGESGYFYYVNAASDPGIIAKLTINDLCPGSTVAVSAWAAEMSPNYSTANISFNFVAVDSKGNAETVHTFVTGFIDNVNFGSSVNREKGEHDGLIDTNHGRWMHIYYSFIPDIDTNKSVDHYELWLENNCVSSWGADYAVDDIRAYIISPAVTARQLSPVCEADQKTVGIRLSSRFTKLLDSNGMVESNGSDGNVESLDLHFAVLDKKKYDALYADIDNTNLTIQDIVEKSIIKVLKGNVENNYTTVSISNVYKDIPDYNPEQYGEAGKETVNNNRYVRTNILPKDDDGFKAGKDYYIVLCTRPKDTEVVLSDFAINDHCAKYAVMTLQGSGVIKIDGIAYNSGDPIEVCAGQSPVVQVDLKMLENGKEVDIPNYNDYVNAPNHYYDWFNGSIDEFMTSPEADNSYYNLLATFRKDENNLETAELPELKEGESDEYAPLRDLIKEGRLVLHASSFVFPPLKAAAGQDTVVVLTAMPIIPGPDDEEGYKVCSQPNEIRLRVANSSPVMYDGFADIKYPQADVPMRVGFRQLNDINSRLDLTQPGKNNLSINNTAVIPAGTKYLELPLRAITSYKGDESKATMDIHGNMNEEADPFVYLVETNDPRYIGLDKHPMDKQAIKNGLLPIGMMEEMQAANDQDNNSVRIVFDKQMQFREGYYYRVRFSFDEVLKTEVGGYCQGQTVFTLKVVPEYLKWTGTDSRNWNNDTNWSRVTAAELLLPENDPKTSDFTIVDDQERIALVEGAQGVIEVQTKEVKGNPNAYAPLDFTKVIVPNLRGETTSKGYPWIFAEQPEKVATLNGDYDWSATADAPGTGVATENIQYDMTSLDKEEKLACRPWYANTCDQIHFNHGSELVHQENFVFGKNYQKAWADMEMTGDRWYTLASPLQGVVAGDMYTRTATGQQDTELFQDITFDTNRIENDRFKPAVYQRGWNKAETKTYFLGDNSNYWKSSAVALNWSRVYNDVKESYAPGTGFSIRTVTDGITSVDKDKTVSFRLPKADKTYNYFDIEGETEAADNATLSRIGDPHSLTNFTDGKFVTTVKVGAEGKYFLVGNPFIARMDMAKFFAANDSIENVYWIMTDDRQDASYWDEKAGAFISTTPTGKEEGIIAPMQGFFVQSKNATKELTLTFTPEMIVEGVDLAGTPELMSTSFYEPQVISVSALDNRGKVASRAVINIDPAASATYNGAEDAAMLLDHTLDNSATVYTVASEQALAINNLDAIVETEIGLLADEGTNSTLVFEGVDNSEGLLLLDTTTGQFSDLYDGMTLDVTGSASGRFYITRRASDFAEPTMAVVLKDRTVSIVAATEGIVARVYTPAGVNMGEWSVDDTSLKFDLEPGIFIIEAVANDQRVIRKFVVK